jgi:Glucose dehydrogenase
MPALNFLRFVDTFPHSMFTGKELWKFYTTPGDPSKGFENKAMEAAAKTWVGEWWKQGGGGSMWDGMAYDPDENLLYVGTGNGTVWSADVRNGGRQATNPDNLYIASILAINADTGQLKWHYQCTPGDQWDYDAIQHLLLADIRINNRNRKVVMQANKNGYFYVIDRTNGEFISASEMSQVSWATGLDPKTGRPNVHPDALYSSTQGVTVYPVQMHNTSQMSFNPNTGLIYVPIAVENTFSFVASETYAPTPGSQNFGLNLAGHEAVYRWHLRHLMDPIARIRWKQSARRYSHRVGSCHSKGTLVRTRRRTVGRWHAVSGFEPCNSNAGQRTPESVHRGQG